MIRCQKATLLCIQGLSSLQEGRLLYCAFCLGGLAVHQSDQGGSFVNYPGLVKCKVDGRKDAQAIPNS